jgi:hypothetical protein
LNKKEKTMRKMILSHAAFGCTTALLAASVTVMLTGWPDPMSLLQAHAQARLSIGAGALIISGAWRYSTRANRQRSVGGCATAGHGSRPAFTLQRKLFTYNLEHADGPVVVESAALQPPVRTE